MLYNIFCPDLELVSFGVWIVGWLKGCVHCACCVCSLNFSKPAVPTAACIGSVGEKSVTLKVKQMLGLYPDSDIQCFLVDLCMLYIFYFLHVMMF